MPLVTAAVLAYAAGLLAGFAGALFWTFAGCGAVVWLGARSPRDRTALSALALAGFTVATSARTSEAACEERLASQTSWRVTLATAASPGAFVAARHDCGVQLRLSVEHGTAPAGALVIAEGEATRARGSILITRAAIRELQGPKLLVRWRNTVGDGIDRHFGADAPLVRALLIADMTNLSPTLRDRFSGAGLSHMLSVSGLHVGLIAVALSLLTQLVGLSRRRSDAIVVLCTAAYVLVIGAPLPAIRAAAMLAASSLGVAVQRPTSAWAVLAVGAALPLIDPHAVLDVGYQLSVVGMVALVAAGALGQRWDWLSGGGWRGTLARSLVASTMATLLTTPLVASTFGRISLVAPLTNLVAVPMMAVLQPMLFLAAALLPASSVAQFVADACHPLLAAVDWTAALGARLPGAMIPVATDQTTTVLASTAVTSLAIAAVHRYPGRALVTAIACIATIAWRPLLPYGAGQTELHVLDVGQGDAIALRTARGRWVLFDAGRDWSGGDAGQRDVIPYVVARGGPVVAFVLSHPHSDHVGGAASALRGLKPAWYFDPGYAGGTTPYRASLVAAQETHTSWRRVHPGDSIVVDETTITFLAPDSAWADTQRDPNLASSIARVRIGSVRFLLTGDAEAGEEDWLLKHESALLSADVLKVAHHGSMTSSTSPFLDAVRPKLAIVSVGAGNMYGHPSAAVMRSLAAHGAITLRTDLQGTVVVRTDGRKIEIEARGEIWPLKR